MLQKLTAEFEIIPAAGEETCEKETPQETVKELSYKKAVEIEKQLFSREETDEDYLIIGADTIVVLNGCILGKPKDEDDAAAALRQLSGGIHQVYTGVTLLFCKDGRREQFCFAEETEVEFYPMSEREIMDYIRTGEPMDKAGSYGIQGIGGRFVKGIKGSYDNVVGLPAAKIYQTLREIFSR